MDSWVAGVDSLTYCPVPKLEALLNVSALNLASLRASQTPTGYKTVNTFS